jgi:hypothetical protein
VLPNTRTFSFDKAGKPSTVKYFSASLGSTSWLKLSEMGIEPLSSVRGCEKLRTEICPKLNGSKVW